MAGPLRSSEAACEASSAFREISVVPDPSAEEQVLRVLRSEWAAFFRRDFDGFARHWVHGPEVRRIVCGPRSGTVAYFGWENMSARVKEAMRKYPKSVVADECLRWDNLQIHVGTDMAWATYDQVAIRQNEGILASNLHHELKILHRVDGEWKLVCLSVTIPDIERTDTPQIELDDQGRILNINMPARERLHDHPALAVSGVSLRARNRKFDHGLQNAVKRGLEALGRGISPEWFVRRPAEAVPLGEDEFGRPLHCWITPEQQRLLVTFDDLYLMQLRLDLAAEIFALSPMQRELAIRLAKGGELASVADELGVSINTLRTHLRRMFDKTGTRSQTGLISTLLSVERPY
jgi:DNA-binding CsgD family transcriptional regulator